MASALRPNVEEALIHPLSPALNATRGRRRWDDEGGSRSNDRKKAGSRRSKSTSRGSSLGIVYNNKASSSKQRIGDGNFVEGTRGEVVVLNGTPRPGRRRSTIKALKTPDTARPFDNLALSMSSMSTFLPITDVIPMTHFKVADQSSRRPVLFESFQSSGMNTLTKISKTLSMG